MSRKASKSPRPIPEPKGGSNKWRFRFALFALVAIAWSNSLDLGYASDGGAVTSDIRIQSATAANIALIFGKHYWWPNPADRLYRPVTTLSYLLNHSLLGAEAAGYHAVNVLLHLANAWLAFELALLLLGSLVPAFCAAAIWAVHPITTEAVTNVAGRADLLAATALLMGILVYARMRSAIGRERWIGAAALFFVALAGVFTKETGAVLLGLIVLWDIAAGFGGWKAIVQRAPLYGAAAASLAIMSMVRARVFAGEPWPTRPFLDNPLFAAGFWSARFTAVKAIGLDLWLLAFPVRLSSDRSYRAIPISHAGDLWAWASLAVILAVLAFAIVRYRKNDRTIFYCAGFLAIALLPASNLIVIIGATAADRFLYLPSIGFALAAAALIFRLRDRRTAAALTAFIVIAFAARTWARNADWNNDLTLSTADVKTEPDSFRLHEVRARRLFAQSPEANVDEAIREGEAAWNILRPVPDADNDQYTPARLGVYYRKKGDLAGADAGRFWYEKSLNVLLRARDISRAQEKAFDDAQRLHGLPLSFRLADDALYFNLAATYAELGKFSDAFEALRYERVLTPSLPDAYEAMARLYISQGDFENATISLDERVLTSGQTQESISALQDLYSRIPEGSCALRADGGGTALNLACPAVLRNRCSALADLSQVFLDARKPNDASHFLQLARAQGCFSLK